MKKRSKRYQEALNQCDTDKLYQLEEAINILKACPKVNFDQSIDIALKLGVDPKKSDQQVRSTVILPHGTGKSLKVVVLAKG